MELPGRIAVGALLGAVATLALHPLSQRYVFSSYLHLGLSPVLKSSPWLAGNLTVLPKPTNTLEASLWMQVGAELLVEGKPISAKDREALIAVAAAAARGDPDNAFWPQMRAVFQWNSGLEQEAVQSWKQASTALQWNDYQSRRLEEVRKELSEQSGGAMGWHYLAAYYERSLAPARTIEWIARLFFLKLKLGNLEELELRVATVRNGATLRDGSRAVAVGGYGAKLVEYSCAPFGAQSARVTPREQILSLDALIASLREAGFEQSVVDVDKAFRDNDAWFALTQPANAVESARRMAGYSILAATVPGLLFGMAIVGSVFMGIAWLFERFPAIQTGLMPPYSSVIGIAAGVAIYLQTGLALAAVVVALCFGFLAYEPTRTRKRIPDRMRGGFRWTVRTLAVLFVASVGAFWIGLTTPAEELVPQLQLPVELFGGNTIFLSIAVLVLSLLLLAAPGWAIVERIPTPVATVRTLREFAFALTLGSLVAGVVVTPVAIYGDRQIQDVAGKVLVNEPAHYLLQ